MVGRDLSRRAIACRRLAEIVLPCLNLIPVSLTLDLPLSAWNSSDEAPLSTMWRGRFNPAQPEAGGEAGEGQQGASGRCDERGEVSNAIALSPGATRHKRVVLYWKVGM